MCPNTTRVITIIFPPPVSGFFYSFYRSRLQISPGVIVLVFGNPFVYDTLHSMHLKPSADKLKDWMSSLLELF